jgi:predicted nucleic acid-binding protein
MRRAYVDSCLVIYWVEQATQQAGPALRWLERNADATLCVSPLVQLETLVKPMRDQHSDLVTAYKNILAAQQWLPIDDTIFARALDLRVRFALKTPDSLHLAIAQHHGCDEFWTNDGRLSLAAGPMARNIFESAA